MNVHDASSMPTAHIYVLFDTAKGEAELTAECPAGGAIVIEPLMGALSKRLIDCECGVTMDIVSEDLRQLRSMAAQFQRVVDDVIRSN